MGSENSKRTQKKNLQALSRASDDSRPGVEEKERRGGSSELDRASWRSVAGGGLDHSPPLHRQRERELGEGARGSFFRYFFCFSLGAWAPTTGHDSVDRQAGCRRFDFDLVQSMHPSHSQRPSPRADRDFFTGARARACARSLAWLETPPALRACNAAGSPPEPDSAGMRRTDLHLVGRPGRACRLLTNLALAFQLTTRWPPLLLTATTTEPGGGHVPVPAMVY